MATKQSNPADKVEQWDITKLVPYARNSRTHSDAQVAQIAASIKEWGWTTPVLVDEDGSIIAGVYVAPYLHKEARVCVCAMGIKNRVTVRAQTGKAGGN